MRGLVETVSRCQQDALLCSSLAESAAVLYAEKPGKRGHSSTRTNPAKYISMLAHEAVELAKILSSSLLRLPQHSTSMAHRDLRQHLSCSVVRDGEIRSCIPVLLATLTIGLDHPPG